MRISNISSFLGGANRIIAREVVKGNRIKIPITLSAPVNGVDTPTPIHNFLFRAYAADFDSSITESGSSLRINTLTESAAPNNRELDIASVVNILDNGVDPTLVGKFDLIIPEDLYPGIVPANTTTPPVVILETKYGVEDSANIGSFDPDTEILSIRWLLILRYSPMM